MSYEPFHHRRSLQLTSKDTNLLDRTAALESEKAANISTASSPAPASKGPATPAPANDGTAAIRRDLAETLRANGQLKSRVTTAERELLGLRAKTKTDTKLIEELSRERGMLSQKVKDRDEELKGKAKFLVVWHPIRMLEQLLTMRRIRRMKSQC